MGGGVELAASRRAGELGISPNFSRQERRELEKDEGIWQREVL